MLPRRGAVALIFTAVGLILLLNFKTPSAPANLALGATVAQAPSWPAPSRAPRLDVDLDTEHVTGHVEHDVEHDVAPRIGTGLR